jgi:hypothetical protein
LSAIVEAEKAQRAERDRGATEAAPERLTPEEERRARLVATIRNELQYEGLLLPSLRGLLAPMRKRTIVFVACRVVVESITVAHVEGADRHCHLRSRLIESRLRHLAVKGFSSRRLLGNAS